MMTEGVREQAYWLLLTFESKLSTRIVNEIIVAWCQQSGRTLQEFFAADPQEWSETCQLNEEVIIKLEQARQSHTESTQAGQEMLLQQVSLIEKLAQDSIHLLTVLDDNYPKLLKSVLKANQIPPILFYAGDLSILDRVTIAIIGSRKATEASLAFTQTVAQYIAERGVNVISGNAPGVDQGAYEGATGAVDGYTTVVLPQGIHTLGDVEMYSFFPKIEAGKVLLLSQFHSDAPWAVGRAMERNKVITGLAQVVIVAESSLRGGTWEAANGALKQKLPVYVRQTDDDPSLAGNNMLIERGARPLCWPSDTEALSPLLLESQTLRQRQMYPRTLYHQLSLLLREQGIYYDDRP